MCDLLVFEARADVAELLVDAEALLLLVVAVADVADEDRQPPHPGERHLVEKPRSACRPARSGRGAAAPAIVAGGAKNPTRRRGGGWIGKRGGWVGARGGGGEEEEEGF